jgi:hypothetical protein
MHVIEKERRLTSHATTNTFRTSTPSQGLEGEKLGEVAVRVSSGQATALYADDPSI